ncbi:MAG: hypothetical protein PUF10_11115 [Bacteroidales bacterium]|nr:hypothetical protein [Bacteroidales bacterium]
MKRTLFTITAMAAATFFFAGCKSPEYKAAEQSIGAIKDSIEAAKSCNDLNDKLNSSFHAATEKYNAVKDSTERAKLDKRLEGVDLVLAKKMTEFNCASLK